MAKSFWTTETRARLVALAKQGITADVIAEQLGTSRGAICTYAGREKIVLHADILARRERERARLRAREKKRAEQKAAAARRAAAKTAEKRSISKTSADYRNRVLPVEILTKSQLRSMLAEAVQNTARL